MLAKLVYNVFSENSKGKNINNIEQNLLQPTHPKIVLKNVIHGVQGALDKVFLSRILTKFYFFI